MQDEVFPIEITSVESFNQAQMSSKGIPQVAIVSGSCMAVSYVPASDESVIVKGRTIFLDGPLLLRLSTGRK